jgi:hypothetical protein
MADHLLWFAMPHKDPSGTMLRLFIHFDGYVLEFLELA